MSLDQVLHNIPVATVIHPFLTQHPSPLPCCENKLASCLLCQSLAVTSGCSLMLRFLFLSKSPPQLSLLLAWQILYIAFVLTYHRVGHTAQECCTQHLHRQKNWYTYWRLANSLMIVATLCSKLSASVKRHTSRATSCSARSRAWLQQCTYNEPGQTSFSRA